MNCVTAPRLCPFCQWPLSFEHGDTPYLTYAWGNGEPLTVCGWCRQVIA